MGIFNRFPWSEEHQLNLDWILRSLKDLLNRVKALEDSGGGGGVGTTDYLDLDNKPQINGVTLTGNKTAAQLNINIPDPSNTTPLMDSQIPQIGSSTNYAREDHVHPFSTELVDAIENISWLQYDNIAKTYGYYNVCRFLWESGSINYPSGTNKNPDVKVIRTALPRLQLTGNMHFIVRNTKYRIKIYTFAAATGNAIAQSNWMTAIGSYSITIDPSKYYRIQIATQQASTMVMDDALRSILVVYDSDYMNPQFDSFWDSYIESKVQTINQYMTSGKNKSVFLFITDTHWNNGPTYLNHYGINTNLMRYVAKRCNIEYLIHGGDLNSENRSDINIARENMTIPMGMMRDAFDHVFVTRGNHDDQIEGANNIWANVITQSDSYSYMFRNTKDVIFGETRTYFYHDIPQEKLRIISLDCIDQPYTNTIDPTKSDLKTIAYGYEQVKWLCNVLKTTPYDYHIVIYTHAMLAPSIVTIEHPNDSPQTRAKNYLVLCDLLKAFKNRQSFSTVMTGDFVSIHQSYYSGTISVDFSECNANIVGVFSGHEHIDCIEEILDSNGAGIGIYNTCTQNSSNRFADTVISYTYQHPMEIGTTRELIWDVVVIDRDSHTVNMIRIGANGANTDVPEINVRTFQYYYAISGASPDFGLYNPNYVQTNQGEDNANKFLVTDSDGVVGPVTIPEWQGGNY